MLFRIFVGLILVALGAVITIFANKIHEALGPIAWAEDHLGTEGGSRLFYKFIGIGLSIVGFLIMTNMISSIILGIVKMLFPGVAVREDV